MRRSTFAWIALLIAAGCVEVPDTIKADFSGPGPADRSNYRPGAHGAARPAEVPPPAVTVATTTDAGAEPAPAEPGDAQ